MPGITPLPPAPSVLDPENFSEEADAFVAALGAFVTELNAIIGTTIPAGSAAANTLTGSTIAANVTASSLTSVGSTLTGPAASQAQQETASAVNVYVTPGRQQYHPSTAKVWAKFNASGTVQASYNVASVSDDGTGLATVVIATDFSSGDYATVGTALWGSGGQRVVHVLSQSVGAFAVNAMSSDNVQNDPTNWFVAAFGDQ